jgi:hypothetical protein
MPRNNFLLLLLLLGALLPGAVRADDQPSPTETRLRGALRDTMLQLRDAQNQMITLQAAQQESDKEKADLQAKFDALTAQLKSTQDQATADKAASDKSIADLKQAGDDLVTEMVNTLSIQINLLNKNGTDDKETLSKSITDMDSKNPAVSKVLDQYGSDIQLWKTGYYQYVQFANATEAARQKLAAEDILLRRTVEDREMKNLVLYNTGSEILDRYEKFSLGEALSAKEPFISLTKVKLQEQVQDYKDKLLSQRLVIGQPISAAAVTAPAPSASTMAPSSAAASPSLTADRK